MPHAVHGWRWEWTGNVYLLLCCIDEGGEHDAKLQWPFREKVTLVLVSQDQQQQDDIVKWFQPDPAEIDGSFWQPSLHCDMNVGFGYPEFAPISVLDDVIYVKNDTMILKCIIDNVCN